jgi:S-adenosylmethionine-diacylglycerol 3-amino-3-carboxypropyl transferase
VSQTRVPEMPSAATDSEAARHADFESILRYAQCWEDADILLEGLDVRPGQVCISIASGGDNSLSLLTRDPGRVVAVDLNPAQLAALELRVAAYRTLDHDELLELIGSRASARRASLYARCRVALGAEARRYGDARPEAVRAGVGSAGKFERYFAIFRRFVLPLVHRRARVAELLVPRAPGARGAWYAEHWDTPAWRGLFRLFFSRRMLGALGRDPSFFRYVEGSVAEHLLHRVRHGLAELDPSANPYARWILTGMHGDVLPHALRAEHFTTIRDRLDRLEWHRASIESLARRGVIGAFDRANLSDIFEYMSPDNAARILHALADVARPGARLAYWNMMVPRLASTLLPERFRRLEELSHRLFEQDKAFFYRDFVVDEVTGS